jgi:hypothetical protein
MLRIRNEIEEMGRVSVQSRSDKEYESLTLEFCRQLIGSFHRKSLGPENKLLYLIREMGRVRIR